MFKILAILLASSVDLIYSQDDSKENPVFILNNAHARYARLRCLQHYPLADINNFADTAETHCYLQCFLYKMGLMDLSTRGLDSEKFMDILEEIDGTALEDICMEKFHFNERLTGNCSDCYRKLMEFRINCLELFNYTFNSNTSISKPEDTKNSKKIGQSATEFCDTLAAADIVEAQETSQESDVTLLTQYKKNLKCIFENFHFLDAYDRVDQSEIISSYQEAQEDSEQIRSIISICTHRANAKYQRNYFGDLVLELQRCLKTASPAYTKVYKLRDKISRHY